MALNRKFSELLIKGLHDAAILIGPDGRLLAFNAAYAAMTGFRPRELTRLVATGVDAFSLLYSEDRIDHDCFNRCLSKQNASRVAEIGVVNRNGSAYQVWLSFLPVIDGENTTEGVVEIIRDVSAEQRVHDRYKELLALTKARADELEHLVAKRTQELQSALEEVTHLSQTDPLTGLFNRRAFFERAEPSLRLSQRYQRLACLIISDLDLFKRVNDRFGHLIGDQVLTACAQALKRTVRQTDLVARFGGEEFIILLTEVVDANLQQVIIRCREAVAALTFEQTAPELNRTITASFGVAVFPQDGSNLEQLISRADQALYQAKAAGRNRVVFFQAADDPPEGGAC